MISKFCRCACMSSKYFRQQQGFIQQRQYMLLMNKPLMLASFSSENKHPNDDKDKKNNKEDKKDNNQNSTGVLSMVDMYNYGKKSGESIWNSLKKLSRLQLAALFVIPISLYLLSDQEVEQYPTNYFEMEIEKNPDYYSELNVIFNIKRRDIQYRIQFTRQSKKYYVTYFEVERFRKIMAMLSDNVTVHYQYQPNLELRLTNLITLNHILGAVFITAFFLRSSSMGGVKKRSKGSGGMLNQMMKKKQFEIMTNTKVKFADVAGLNQSKMEVKEFVDFLKNPAKYKKLGARIPKGVLLSGPPGTGKTMLGKACAGEAGVPFIPVSGSDFVQIFVGVGASRVRDLFELARQKAPSIIFIDEIDAVGRKRSGAGHGSHDQRDNTLNQILVEMDGFSTESNVIVMAATNRPNLLDNALVRPGRFDRIVQINLPDLQGRKDIFNVHLQKIQLKTNRTIEDYARRLATLTPGFSGAEIANLCNQAAILAARNNKVHVDAHDLEMATQRIIGGIQRKSLVSTQEKRIVSVHESGHAVVSWYLKGADPLLKLTIIPRSKGSLGFAQYFVNETKLNTRSQLIDRICFILGGRCAEEKFFGKITNGASDDLKKAYQIAHSIVVKLGMSDQIGYIGYKDPEYFRPYSEQMAQKVDFEIKRILTECTVRTQKMVQKYQTEIKKYFQPNIFSLSDELFEKETLTIRQIRRILGERDFTSNDTYNQYLQVQKQMDEKDRKETEQLANSVSK